MTGLFLENGPLRIKKTGETNDDYILGLNPEGSWVDIADMVYLDQPVGTGFSYGDSFLTSMEDIAEEFMIFMKQFLALYPEYSSRKFYLTGESFAGQYIPLFATKLIENPDINVNLKALLISNPLASPMV